jgi:hypothetical protein
VDSQAQAAFEAADVVLEEVRVLVEVDGLERQLPETLPSVGICSRLRCDTAAAELGACTVLSLLTVGSNPCAVRTYLIVHRPKPLMN